MRQQPQMPQHRLATSRVKMILLGLLIAGVITAGILVLALDVHY
jgi:hypothetical protein